MEAQNVVKGTYILYNKSPHLVTRKEVVVYGTHSHSKTKIYLKPLEGGGEKSLVMAHHDHVDALDIQRKSAQVISRSGDLLQIMDNVSFETFDAELADGVEDEIMEGDEVTFVNFGKATVLSLRTRR